jgi:hypothetical protein
MGGGVQDAQMAQTIIQARRISRNRKANVGPPNLGRGTEAFSKAGSSYLDCIAAFLSVADGKCRRLKIYGGFYSG